MDEVRDLFGRMAQRSLAGQWVSARYEHRVNRSYLETVVAPSMGSSAAALSRPGRSTAQAEPEYDLYREELQLAADGRWSVWRATDSVESRQIFDGKELVNVLGDGEVVRRCAPERCGPGIDPDWNLAPATSWTCEVGVDFRLMLEPGLLPGIAEPVAATTPAGEDRKVLLRVRPRNVDLFTCSLLSPWAQAWQIVVDTDSALLWSATAFDAEGQVVVEHVITRYETGPEAIDESAFAIV